MRTKKKSLLADLLAEITPIEQAKTDARMILASKIDAGLKSKKWSKKQLMETLGKKNPSVITRYLSGTHNFTSDTLVEIENALDISLLNLKEKDSQKAIEYHAEVDVIILANYQSKDTHKKDPYSTSIMYGAKISC